MLREMETTTRDYSLEAVPEGQTKPIPTWIGIHQALDQVDPRRQIGRYYVMNFHRDTNMRSFGFYLHGARLGWEEDLCINHVVDHWESSYAHPYKGIVRDLFSLPLTEEEIPARLVAGQMRWFLEQFWHLSPHMLPGAYDYDRFLASRRERQVG